MIPSEKSLLLKHLADLNKTISACLRFGVAYVLPGHLKVPCIKLDTGLETKPVSNFADLLLWVQILLQEVLAIPSPCLRDGKRAHETF